VGITYKVIKHTWKLLVDRWSLCKEEFGHIYIRQQPQFSWSGCCAGISVCTSLGLNLEPLLAVGGAGGIAAGFASQQVLINMVSGGLTPHLYYTEVAGGQ
jgi:hypothetical protein